MNITLKLSINDQVFEIVANATLKVCRIYRQQFGRDLIKDMSEINKMIKPSIYDFVDTEELAKINTENVSEEELNRTILKKVYPAYRKFEKEVLLDTEHTERANQIIWAFAKNADENLPGYEDWIDEFDFILPVKKIIPALYDAWEKSAQPIVEVKN